MNRRFGIGIAAALAGATLWGFSGACAQIALGDYGLDVAFITWTRGLIAAVFLAVVSAVRYRGTLRAIATDAPLRPRLLIFGVGLFLSQFTFTLSVGATNAGTATVLQSLATVFVMVAACMGARRLPRGLEVAGVACALAATWLIATQGNPGVLVLPPAGLFWGIVNALGVTLYITSPRPLYAKYPTIPVAAFGMLMSTAISLVIWLVQGALDGGVALPPLDAGAALVLFGGIGFLGTALAFGLYLYGCSVVGPIPGALLGAAEPASAMVLTALWLGTVVTGADWAGLVLMVAMIVLVALSGANPRPRDSAQ